MSTKKRKTNKRGTMKYYSVEKNIIVQKLLESIHNIHLTYLKNNTMLPLCVFEELFNKTKLYINTFIKNYTKLPKRLLSSIENTIKNIKYHNEPNIKSKLFEYVEILNELNLFLDEKKHKDLIEMRNEINDEIYRFIYFLNDSTSQKGQE
jgi:hypothetical protein